MASHACGTNKKVAKRYLQAAYSDPITGKKFELIKVGEELHGVRSSSTDIPYNRVGFKGAKTYQAIRFESTGANANCQLNPLNPTLPTNCAPPGTALPSGHDTPFRHDTQSRWISPDGIPCSRQMAQIYNSL